MIALPPLKLQFGVIADDFTGAMDTGVQFALCGLPTRVSLDGAFDPQDQVVVLTTDSRELDVDAAAERAAQAARRLVNRRLYKKIDSTIRGHVGAEISAVLRETALRKAVVCPAVPAAGRVIRGGGLFVNGIPLHQTSFAKDPGWPAQSSDIATRIGFGAQSIPLDVVRGTIEEYRQAVLQASGEIAIADCEAEADLDCTGALLLEPLLLACGALGLAAAWLKAIGYHKVAQDQFQLPKGPFLAVCGSVNPAAQSLAVELAQRTNALQVIVSENHELEVDRCADAIASERPVVIMLDSTQPRLDRLQGVSLLAQLAAVVCRRSAPTGLFLFGGETARRVLDEVNSNAVWVERELTPGMAYGHIEGGLCARKWIITQSGGLSSVDFFANAGII